jgi:hypothetical protein
MSIQIVLKYKKSLVVIPINQKRFTNNIKNPTKKTLSKLFTSGPKIYAINPGRLTPNIFRIPK